MPSNTFSRVADQPPVARIEALRLRHASFERRIEELQNSPSAASEIAVLKKDKLRIKDEIARLTTH